MTVERTLLTETHGRYLTDQGEPGHVYLIGFHGYAEAAEAELQRMKSIDGSAACTLVAIQALHSFYRGRSNDVVASWMTRQDRELAIKDNIAYTLRVIDAVERETGPASVFVLSGFSQGVAMAYRTACSLPRAVAGVIALGGDIPPELTSTELSRVPSVLIGRGIRDEWYSEDKLKSDTSRLYEAGTDLQVLQFEGGHEWTAEFAGAASAFLARTATSLIK